MISEVEVGQYVWFVIPQELSWYPVVIGARVERVDRAGVEVRWQYPHAVFGPSELYSTKKKAASAAVEVLKQKVERMRSRTIEMQDSIVKWEQRNDKWCALCDKCDIDEYSLDKPCQEWNQAKTKGIIERGGCDESNKIQRA